ncbi:MAG TPA: flagellin [Succinivibrionaceae bacterium]|nr:flagellin [Succinivibrionaceae bacterium]
MSMSVNSSSAVSSGINNLNKTQNTLDTIYERLSSGKRINSAKDDAAGLQISDRMLSQLEGLNQANRNANYSIAYNQIAESALSGTTEALQSMRSLAVQSANGTYSDSDRAAMQQEMDQMAQEVDHIAQNTTYNGTPMLDGSASEVVSQVGPNAGDTIDASSTFEKGFGMSQMLSSVNTDATVLNQTDAEGNAYQSLSIGTQEDAESAIGTIDSMISYVDSARGELGAVSNRLESTISVNTNAYISMADAQSRIADADMAEEASNKAAASVLEQAQVAMLTQANAKRGTAMALLS